MEIKVLIAEDHHIVRKGLMMYLEMQEGISVTGEAENGKEAAELAAQLKPDVIVMDLSMPVCDGISATQEIISQDPSAKILILTSYSDEHHIISALKAGASGFQFKDTDPARIVEAIRAVYKGEKQLDPKAADSLFIHIQSGTQPSPAALTPREREVLAEIASGKSNKEIAGSLFITEKTVKTHVSHILSKLELQDRTQAALYAVRNGMAGPPK